MPGLMLIKCEEKHMKKLLNVAAIAAVLFSAFALVACGTTSGATEAAPEAAPAEEAAPAAAVDLPAYTDANGQAWQGSVFGDVGEGNITAEYFNATVGADGSINLSVKENKGKIASTSDGLLFYYTAVPAGSSFTLTADALVNEPDPAANQVSYGLMARDDVYVNEYHPETMGDYVAAGPRTTSKEAFNCFGRQSGAIVTGPSLAKAYKPGETVSLSITGAADSYTLKFGDNDEVPLSYALTAKDSANVYVGFFVARNANVTFSNVKLTVQ